MARLVSIAKQTGCKYCKRRTRDGDRKKDLIDHKNVRLLQKFSTPQGKLYGRKRSGLCAHCQRRLKRAVKRARFLGLISYVGHK